MILLLLFAFAAGVVTVLSPCILPMLPIILSSGISGDAQSKARPLGVVAGFVASFTLFTLFLSALVQSLGIPTDALRSLSIVVIAGFGVSLLIPSFQLFLENLFSKLSQFVPTGGNKTGFHGGFVIGLSVGLLWTPCVGPILASVISLALTGDVSVFAFLITLAYAVGTAIPMLAIMWGGRTLLQRIPWLATNTDKIQKGFGLLMILLALALITNTDRRFQTLILNVFPSYGSGLTAFENTDAIATQLNALQPKNTETPTGPLAPELIPGGAWINSEPLTLAELKGKVVIVDFWTYSCINCQRTLPYIEKWYETYKDKGLVVIGIHAPEFTFEKDTDNVRKAVKDFGLTYPIMQDNDFATWRAYRNQYWPAKYFIDKNGNVRYTHFGEGGYDESERIIQQLLQETGTQVDTTISNPTQTNFAGTPETYVGFGRMQYFSSPEKVVQNAFSTYTAPAIIPSNTFAFSGSWEVMSEYARPQKGASLSLNFDAKDVYLVMRPKNGSGVIKVTIDGEAQFFGTDGKDGAITIDTDKLYNLVHLTTPGRHILKIEFEDDNVEVFAFTFG